MSLILDALNRSRQDAAGSPGLSSSHFGEGAPGGRNGLQWLLVVALGLAVLVIGWLLLDRPQPSPTPPQAGGVTASPALPTGQPPAPAAAERVAVEPAAVEPAVVEPAAVEPAAVEPAATVSDGPAAVPAATPSGQPQVSPPGPAPATDPESARVDESVAALYQQREEQAVAAVDSAPATPAVPAPAPAVQEEAVDIQQLVARAQAELKDAELGQHEVPLISTLSQQTKDAIPTVMYQRHDYSGVAAQSSVVINGKSLRAGMSAGGFAVEEILPDSVVLNYRGTRFRLRALNSWVNL